MMHADLKNSFYQNGIKHQAYRLHVPLDHTQPQGKSIEIFWRVLSDAPSDRPYLLYLQGGPGFESPRPDASTGWFKRALQSHQIVLLDQRGTGLSTPIEANTLGHLDPQDQASYLKHFRADSIVRDAECVRKALGVERWAILGQSFGGFCTWSYLSLFPKSLLAAYITGGTPAFEGGIDQVYDATYQTLQTKNQAFFHRFKDAQSLCDRIALHLHRHEVHLPNAQVFTPEQFALMGIALGASGGDRELYFWLERAFADEQTLSYAFLNYAMQTQSYLTNPLYALLHESIYCQGFASNWSANRLLDKYHDFVYDPDKPFCFTAEMVYPWFFEQLHTLKPFAKAAQLLAEKSNWGRLYDPSALQNNTVPVAAMVYVEDLYVPFEISKQSLDRIPYSKALMTNAYEHNGLREDGGYILDTLIKMGEDLKNS